MNNENLTNAGQGQPRKNYKQVTLGLPDRTLAILDKHKASMPAGKRTRNELLIAIVDLLDSRSDLMAELFDSAISDRQVKKFREKKRLMMNILSVEYKEGHEDLAKHGCPRFYIQVELTHDDLPGDTCGRDDGVEIWRDKLSGLGISPDSIQRLGGWTHEAQLFWHDRESALKAFRLLAPLQKVKDGQ